MKKLIEADQLRQNIRKYMQDCKHAPTRQAVCKHVLSMLGDERCPSVDPVHAAGGCYCRECKYWSNSVDIGYCSACAKVAIPKGADDFCSHGVRRESGK